MRRARQVLLDDERASINRSVAKAGKRTAVDIVPVVATASGRYDRAEDVVGVWAALAAFALAWLVAQDVVPSTSSWTEEPAFRLGLLPLLGILVFGFVAGAVAAGRTPWLRRLFVPRREMEEETRARAKAVYFDQQLRRPGGPPSVLLYVSLFEGMAAVLVGEEVGEKLGERSLQEVCDQVIAGVRASGPVEGMLKGLERLGELLAVAFPAGEARRSETTNEIIVLE